MAVTVTQVYRDSIMAVFDVTATADADAAAVVAHQLPGAPVFVQLTPLGTPALNTATAWSVTAVSAVSVTLGKATGVGSGDPAASVRVMVMLAPALWPHGLAGLMLNG